MVRDRGLEPLSDSFFMFSLMLIVAFCESNPLVMLRRCPCKCKHFLAFMCNTGKKNVCRAVSPFGLCRQCVEIEDCRFLCRIVSPGCVGLCRWLAGLKARQRATVRDWRGFCHGWPSRPTDEAQPTAQPTSEPTRPQPKKEFLFFARDRGVRMPPGRGFERGVCKFSTAFSRKWNLGLTDWSSPPDLRIRPGCASFGVWPTPTHCHRPQPNLPTDTSQKPLAANRHPLHYWPNAKGL
jgi:hypothetical protein